MNIHFHTLISSFGVTISEMIFLHRDLLVLNPWSLELVICQFIQMTIQLLNDVDDVTMDLCQIQTNDLVVSNPVNHISLNAYLK